MDKTHRALPHVEYLLLGFTLFAYLIVGGLFAVFTPAWQSPDEPAHYNYIAQVAANGCCPVIETGDWDQVYQNRLTSARFSPELLDRLDAVQYEDHQPPLYYVLASVVFRLFNGSLIALRLFSVIIGAGVVLCAYGVSKTLLPGRPQIALGSAALVAFLPQHVAMLASVNNDGLSELLIGAALLLTVGYLRDIHLLRRLGGWPVMAVALGIVVGMGFITKASAYFLAVIVPLAMLLKWWPARTEPASTRALRRDLLLFLIPALILGGMWWIRNFGVYGFPDLLGLRAHNIVVADQPRTAERIAQLGFGGYLGEGLQTTFNSFWGQFGWMALPMPGWIYALFIGLLVVTAGGLVLQRWMSRRSVSHSPEAGQRRAVLILALTALLALVQYVYYNTEFLQFQGRYLFPGLIPFALSITLGLNRWLMLLPERSRIYRLAQWLTALIFLPLAALDVYILWRFIVPLLSP